MTADISEKRIHEIIAEQLGIGEEEITDSATFVDDLGADSLDIVELVMALEEEFSTEIPDDDAERMKTVGDLVAYLASKKAQ